MRLYKLGRKMKCLTRSLVCSWKCGLEHARPENAIRNMELSLLSQNIIFVIGDIFPF